MNHRTFIQLGFINMEQMNSIIGYLKTILRAGSETVAITDSDKHKSDTIRQSRP